MKINIENKNVIGKLCYFKKPIFRLEKLLEDPDEFTRYIEDNISIQCSNPIVQPIDPGRVLGKEHPTLKYQFAVFKDKEYDILENFSLGFGEKGYYYDLYLKFDDNEQNFDPRDINSVLEEVDNLSTKIENNLENYYFIKPTTHQKLEISNFVISIDFEKALETLLNNKLYTELENLAISSEPIVQNIENRINFNMLFTFYPQSVEDGVISNVFDIIIPERTITFIKDFSKPKVNRYNVRIRGLPAKDCIHLLIIIGEILG